jgi:AraC-like DNA-binding protein
LAPHGIYTAADPAEAASFGRDLLGVHRIHVANQDLDAFEATFHAVLVRDVTLGYLDYSTAVRIDVQQLPDDVLVIVPANGVSRIQIGETTVETSPVRAAVPRPGGPVVIECEADAAHLVIRIDRDAFEVHLSRLIGRSLPGRIDFEPAFDLTDPAASRWNFAIQMLHAEVYEQSSLLHAGVGHGQIEEFIMSSLLYSQSSNYSAVLRPSQSTERQTVRSACDFIEQNLATELSVAAIAGAANVSVRTLQHQFAEDLQQTITGYVRNRRLDRVRAELADGVPGTGLTVTNIATRWGFNHLGRFAVTYRKRFGESPSTTLRS